MATKPTSASFTWSTDDYIASGPAVGAGTNPTKVAPAGWPSNLQGFVPGLKYVSEFRNWLWNIMGQWTGWLEAGSSAGAADAHIVETDSSGNTTVQSLEVLANLSVDASAEVGGNLTAAAGVDLSGVISPGALGATQENWEPPGIATATVVRVTTGGSGTSLRAIVAPEGSKLLILAVVGGGGPLTLEDEAVSSDAGGRFAIPAPVAVGIAECAIILYDQTSSRWRLLASP